MTDEQIWLLRFGRGWVDWWELADNSGEGTIMLYERLIAQGKLEMDATAVKIRLKAKEENESIRV